MLRYEDAPTPMPGVGEVLVKIHATSVNPVDCKARAGVMSRFRPLPLPFILGWDFSGTIAALGEGVTEWTVGDEVYGHPPIFSSGTYAEYTIVPSGACARKPVSIDHAHAAAVPLTGLTAWQALFEHAQLQPGQRVLIQSGAGGVGSLELDEPFDRAWRRVGLALDRVGFTVEDRDRSKGYYFVRYVDPQEDAVDTQKKEGGVLSRLMFWQSTRKDAKAEQYRVMVQIGIAHV